MYFKSIFVHLTQVTAQAIILETFGAAMMETWLLLRMSGAMEFQAKEMPLISATAPKVPVSNTQARNKIYLKQINES